MCVFNEVGVLKIFHILHMFDFFLEQYHGHFPNVLLVKIYGENWQYNDHN